MGFGFFKKLFAKKPAPPPPPAAAPPPQHDGHPPCRCCGCCAYDMEYMYAMQKLRSIEMESKMGRLKDSSRTRQMGNHDPNSHVYHRRQAIALPPPNSDNYPAPPPAAPPAFDDYAPTHDDYYASHFFYCKY